MKSDVWMFSAVCFDLPGHSETPLLQSLPMVFNQKIMWLVTMLSTPISNPALAETLLTL